MRYVLLAAIVGSIWYSLENLNKKGITVRHPASLEPIEAVAIPDSGAAGIRTETQIMDVTPTLTPEEKMQRNARLRRAAKLAIAGGKMPKAQQDYLYEHARNSLSTKNMTEAEMVEYLKRVSADHYSKVHESLAEEE